MGTIGLMTIPRGDILSFLKGLFISSKEIWQQFSEEISGEYIDGGFFKSRKVIGKFENWTIVLDTFSRSSGKSSTTYTRIRAPFKTLDELYFKINRVGLFSSFTRAFSGNITKTGDLKFDEEFIIKGNNERKIKEIFSSDELKRLISNQEKIYLKIKDEKKIFDKNISETNYELYYERVGIIKDIEALKELFILFIFLLNTLYLVGSASKEEII